jgi:hypothetical protein
MSPSHGTAGSSIGRFPASNFREGHPGDDEGADEQQTRLDHVGEHHRGQAAENGVGAGQQTENQYGLRQRDIGEDELENQAAGVQVAGGVDDDVPEQGEAREVVPGPAVEPALQKLRHRVDTGLDIERGEEDGEEHQNDGGHPLVVEHRDARAVGVPAQPDERGAPHVGGVQRYADHRPDHAPAGQEVLLGVLVLTAEVDPDRDDEDRVHGYHREIDSAEGEGHARPASSAGFSDLPERLRIDDVAERIPGCQTRDPKCTKGREPRGLPPLGCGCAR